MAQRVGFPAVIDLTNCNRVTDDAITAISLPHRGPSLQRLCLARCDSVTSFGVVVMAAQCSNLRVLDLSRCRKINGNVSGNFDIIYNLFGPVRAPFPALPRPLTTPSHINCAMFY